MKRMLLFILFGFTCCNMYGFMDQHKAAQAYRAGCYKEALEQFETLLTQNPDEYELNYNAGKAAYQQEEYTAAAAYFSHAVAQEDIPDQLAKQASFDLGNTYVKQKKWDDALQSYEQVLTYDPEHEQAQEMIEKIKQLLEAQEQQSEEQDQQGDQQQKEEQSQDGQDQQKSAGQQSGDGQQDTNGQQQQSDGQQGQQEQQQGSDQGDPQKDEQKSDQQQDKGDQSDGTDDGSSEQEIESDTSAHSDTEKQDLDQQNAKEKGEKEGEEGQADQTEKDLKGDRGDQLENSVPDIQDHKRKEDGSDHATSTPELQSETSTEQHTPVEMKAQEMPADPFTHNDDIDQDSKEGKLLQFIEARDAKAARQLLKMNLQAQRRPGEKNW